MTEARPKQGQSNLANLSQIHESDLGVVQFNQYLQMYTNSR